MSTRASVFTLNLFSSLLLLVSTILFTLTSTLTSVCLATNLQNQQVQNQLQKVQNQQINSKSGATVETIASFKDMVPRSIAVSSDHRIFLCCPRGHNLESYTLVEVKNDGSAVPYPDAHTNKIDLQNLNRCFLSAMAAVVDDSDKLWVLDNGRKNRTLVYGGAKLVGIDLKTNKIFKTILLKNFVLSPDIVLYDLEIDPSHGKSGTALISASGSVAPGIMIVSDLETGHTIRRLNQHASLYPNENLSAFVEGELVQVRRDNDLQHDWLPGTFGFKINGKHDLLYYSAVASQDIFSVDLNKLCDPNVSNKDVENSIKHIDYKITPGTGIECDKQNRIYLSDIEHNTIWRHHPDGTIEIVARSEYHRGSRLRFGEDERFAPFEILRIFVNTTSATLCSHTF
jgi:hypothetical protein